MKRKISGFKNKNCDFLRISLSIFLFLTSVGQGLTQTFIYEIRNGECPIAHTVSCVNILCSHKSGLC